MVHRQLRQQARFPCTTASANFLPMRPHVICQLAANILPTCAGGSLPCMGCLAALLADMRPPADHSSSVPLTLPAVPFLLTVTHRHETAVIAALLHDTLDDTATTPEAITAAFGPTVTAMVVSVSKLSAVNQMLRRDKRKVRGPGLVGVLGRVQGFR